MSQPPPPPPPQTDRPPIPPSGKIPLSTPLLYIAQTQTKGLGLFATHDLPPNTLLLLESPILYLSNSEITDLTPHSQSSWTPLTTYLNGILPDSLTTTISELPFAKQFAFYDLSYGQWKGSMERSIVWRNGFGVESLGATVVGGMVSRLNHACVPNAKISWCTALEMEASGKEGEEQEGCVMSGGLNNGEVFTAGSSQHFDELVFEAPKERGGKMMLWNHLPVKKGEEVTIDYGYGLEELKNSYGFDCTCPVCISGLVRSDLAESRRGSIRYDDRESASSYRTCNQSANNISESIEAVTRNHSYDRLAKQRSKNSGIGVLETLYRVQGDQAGDSEDEEMESSEYQTCEEEIHPLYQRPLPPIPEKDSPAVSKMKEPEQSTNNSSYADIFDAKEVNYTKLNHSSLHLVNVSKDTPPASSQTASSLHPSASCSLSPPSSDSEDSNLPPLRHPETLGDLITISTSNKHHGLGVFALKSLMSGTLVLLEAPLLRLCYPTSSHRECKHLIPDPIDAIVHALPPSRRSAFCSLYRYTHTQTPANPYREIIWTNAFGVNVNDSAVFEVTCRFNHACRPNCKWHWKYADGQKGEVEGKMMVYAMRDIAEGEELSIDYGFTRDELENKYGFRCDCGNCDEIREVKTIEGGRKRLGGFSEGPGTDSTPRITAPTTNETPSTPKAKAEKETMESPSTLTELQKPNHASPPQNPSPESPLDSSLRAPFTHKPPTSQPPPRRRPETLGSMLEIRPAIQNNLSHGLGLFTLHNIQAGRLLLDEAPLFTYPSHATFPHILYKLSKLEPEEMEVINSLCSRPAEPEMELDELLRSAAFLRLDGKVKGIFEVACRINHACSQNANCNWVWGQRMLVRAKREILKGEEVTISYGVEDRKKMLEDYGFVCACGVGCVNDKKWRIEEDVEMEDC